jgi:polyhydroxybutyrate depolymerase
MTLYRWLLHSLAVVGLVAYSLVSGAAAELLKIPHQGVDRTAILHRPAAAQPGARPLVVALHGQGGTAEDFRAWAGLDAVAEREGFLAVFPDAVDGRWSYGRPIIQPMPTIGSEPADDAGFLRRLIDDLVARKLADPARVYVFGVSRGGLMAFTAACVLDDLIAAAAPILTGMTEHQREDCTPKRPMPLVAIAGTEDAAQMYDGWLHPTGRLLSVSETLEFWRARHGCTAQEAGFLPHRDRADRTNVMLVEWTRCATDRPLRFYRVQGGGHQMPSTLAAATPLTESRFGRRSRDFETAEEVWKFFKRFVR